MKKVLAVFLIYGIALVAEGRGIVPMSYQQMYDRADLVLIAQPTSVRDTAERINLPNISPAIPAVGVETEFLPQVVIKGNATNSIVLHHYHDANPTKTYRNGPMLVSFRPAEQQSYVLFLKKEVDGRFAPIMGQTDPNVSGIFPSKLVDLVVIGKAVSAKKSVEDTAWNHVSPRVYLTGYHTEFQVQKVLYGDKSVVTVVFHHLEQTRYNQRKVKYPDPRKIGFEPERDQLFLLFLKKELDGRFGPMTRPGIVGAETTPNGFPIIQLEKGRL